jgi:hypothetical protein
LEQSFDANVVQAYRNLDPPKGIDIEAQTDSKESQNGPSLRCKSWNFGQNFKAVVLSRL